jgi:hypothetical protein
VSTDDPTSSPDRRQVLALFAAAAGMALVPVPGEAAAPTANFRAASARLNGLASGLDPATLKRFFTALEDAVGAEPLRRLAEIAARHDGDALDAAIAAAGLDPAANTVVAAWYTGIVVAPDGTRQAILWDDALVWAALDFTKPPAQCAGTSWADEP